MVCTNGLSIIAMFGPKILKSVSQGTRRLEKTIPRMKHSSAVLAIKLTKRAMFKKW